MREQLDRQLEEFGARGHRALVAGVIRGGERVCRGWSAGGDEPDHLSLFEIGSITKAFTGVLLADMTLRGEVALEDPLSRHLSDPRPFPLIAGRHAPARTTIWCVSAVTSWRDAAGIRVRPWR